MNTVLTFFSVFALLIFRINGVEEAEWKLFKEGRKIGKQIHTKKPALSYERAGNKLNSRGSFANDKRITHYASCGTQEDTGYTGAGARIAVYNPSVGASGYSAARMKIHFGDDSIEAGWRVDPALYGDNKTRLFIRTDASSRQPGSHCFNTQCPGFVVTDKSTPLDFVLDKISKTGGPIYAINWSITLDGPSARWILKLAGSKEIGYWPSFIFKKPGSADSVEWGGEVSGPAGTILPGMGASHDDLSFDTNKDAFFSNVKVIKGPTTGGTAVDPTNVKCSKDDSHYAVEEEGNVGAVLEYLIFYGGPTHNTG